MAAKQAVVPKHGADRAVLFIDAPAALCRAYDLFHLAANVVPRSGKTDLHDILCNLRDGHTRVHFSLPVHDKANRSGVAGHTGLSLLPIPAGLGHILRSFRLHRCTVQALLFFLDPQPLLHSQHAVVFSGYVLPCGDQVIADTVIDAVIVQIPDDIHHIRKHLSAGRNSHPVGDLVFLQQFQRLRYFREAPHTRDRLIAFVAASVERNLNPLRAMLCKKLRHFLIDQNAVGIDRHDHALIVQMQIQFLKVRPEQALAAGEQGKEHAVTVRLVHDGDPLFRGEFFFSGLRLIHHMYIAHFAVQVASSGQFKCAVQGGSKLLCLLLKSLDYFIVLNLHLYTFPSYVLAAKANPISGNQVP